MKTLTLVYYSEFNATAQKLIRQLATTEFSIFQYSLSINTVDLFWSNYKTSLVLSDFIIPILYPIQASDENYSDIRQYYELAGDVEKQHGKACLPIYLTSPDLHDDLKKGMIRYPQHFFTNSFSLNWNKFLSDEENFNIFQHKFAALQKLQQIETQAPSTGKFEDVLQLIAQNKLQPAILSIKTALAGLKSGKEYLKNIISIENQFSHYKQMGLTGAHNPMELVLEKNKITSRMLQLIELIEDNI